MVNGNGWPDPGATSQMGMIGPHQMTVPPPSPGLPCTHPAGRDATSVPGSPTQ